MMILNLRVGFVIMQMTNMQNMNIYEIITQNIPNLYDYPLDES